MHLTEELFQIDHLITELQLLAVFYMHAFSRIMEVAFINGNMRVL